MSLDIDVAGIMNAVAWPSVVATLLIVYRRHIGKFLRDISPRIRSLSIGPFSIDLAEAKGFEPKWKGQGPMDVRQSDIRPQKDSRAELIKLLEDVSLADYVIFDLGNGEEWLSSRLYLFTVILQRMRGSNCRFMGSFLSMIPCLPTLAILSEQMLPSPMISLEALSSPAALSPSLSASKNCSLLAWTNCWSS
jgi:hypothetical protein